MIAATAGGASEPSDTLLPGKAGGTVAVRRTLASTICRIADPTQVPRPRQLRDASTVMRFRPAHQSMINRRFDDRASRPARQSPKPALERKPRIHLPATWKGDMRVGRYQPRRLRPRRHQRRGDVAEQSGVWAGNGKGEPDARRRLDNPRAELQEAQAKGSELSSGEHVCLRDDISDGEHQPVGRVCRIRRIWLASGLRQLVRSEASCALCDLMRFSAWPRAQ